MPVPDPGRQIYLEEAKIRIEAALGAEIGFDRAAGLVLVQSFLHLGRQDSKHVRGL